MYPTLECRADVLKMLDEITRTRKRILTKCRTVAAEQLQNPVAPGTWSILQLLQHLAWVESYMLAWILKRQEVLPREEYPPSPSLDLESIEIALDEAHASILAFVKGHDESVLRERCQYGRSGEQTVGGVLFHLIEHEIHHRAFLLHKLAALDRKEA